MDYSQLFAGVNVSPAIAAIIAAGILLVAVGFASWLTDVVASFFDNPDADEEEWEGGDWYCEDCGYVHEGDEGIHWGQRGQCCKCGEPF